MDNFSAAHAFGTAPPLHVLLFSTLPVVIGGVLNLAFIKSSLLDGLRRPIDGGRTWKDGGPVFGPNKTWKGLLGCVFFTSVAMVMFCLALGDDLEAATVYRFASPGGVVGWAVEGALLGLAYILFELPNSFVKRRFGIGSGQNGRGAEGAVFRLVDQVDSILGCCVVMLAYSQITLTHVALLLLFGAFIHWGVSGLLHVAGLR